MGSDSEAPPDDGESNTEEAAAPAGDGEAAMPDSESLTCAVCGATIDRSDWHPVRSWTDEDGQFHMAAYCSMACRSDHVPE